MINRAVAIGPPSQEIRAISSTAGPITMPETADLVAETGDHDD
jgi:hypothetical protein